MFLTLGVEHVGYHPKSDAPSSREQAAQSAADENNRKRLVIEGRADGRGTASEVPDVLVHAQFLAYVGAIEPVADVPFDDTINYQSYQTPGADGPGQRVTQRITDLALAVTRNVVWIFGYSVQKCQPRDTLKRVNIHVWKKGT